jgi:diacylglycerol O-acyltransferase
LAYIDQASFLGLRALGRQPYFQGMWLYDRPVDLEGLRAFNENLAHTLLGRLIEPSPLPWGRHRWVRSPQVPEILVESVARDRSEINAWAESIAELPIDPEHGPGWRLAVLPLTDGGSVVTMPIPHALGDGLCVLQALSDAAAGRLRGPRYPERGAVSKWRRFFGDLGSSFAELPSVARAAVAALKVLRAGDESAGAERTVPELTAPRALPAAGHGQPFRVPIASILVPQAEWDAVAARLGGTSNTLVSAVAASLGERLGRVGADGLVRLAVPVSIRESEDTRANALDGATIPVEPGSAVTDLRPLRAATKKALSSLGEASHALLAALPLTPYLPRALVRKTEAVAMGATDLPVGCSNYGDLNPLVGRIDGADASAMWARLKEPGLSAADLDRIGGQTYVLSGRILGHVFLSTVAHVPGESLETAELHRLVSDVLAAFDLTGEVVGWA